MHLNWKDKLLVQVVQVLRVDVKFLVFDLRLELDSNLGCDLLIFRAVSCYHTDEVVCALLCLLDYNPILFDFRAEQKAQVS